MAPMATFSQTDKIESFYENFSMSFFNDKKWKQLGQQFSKNVRRGFPLMDGNASLPRIEMCSDRAVKVMNQPIHYPYIRIRNSQISKPTIPFRRRIDWLMRQCSSIKTKTALTINEAAEIGQICFSPHCASIIMLHKDKKQRVEPTWKLEGLGLVQLASVVLLPETA